jgi:hypothetical protein
MAFMVIVAPMAYAQNLGQMGYFTTGKVTSTSGGVVNKVIKMQNARELNLILTATGGNFGSKFLIVQTSIDNSVFTTVDNISLTTTTLKAVAYSQASKATTVPVNPAAYPWVKVFVSAGNTGVTENLYYSGIR